MSKLLNISLDVTKLDKNKLIKGSKGTYANITVSVNDEDDQYGNNVSLWISQTKEEREAKESRVFLGNGKVVFDGDNKGTQQTKQPAAAKKEEAFDDLPF